MAQTPYAYDKNPAPARGRLRLWIGVALLAASLVALTYMFWILLTAKPPREAAPEAGWSIPAREFPGHARQR